MPDKPTATDVPPDISSALDDLVRRAAHAMAPEDAFADHGQALRASPSQCRADDLARLRAVEALRADLTLTARNLAHRAGGRSGAPVTYADLGDAVGITRQAAVARWAGAIPDAMPGRPHKQVTVRFRGGPAQWDGYEMAYPASALEGELGVVGAYIVVDADQVPEGVPADSRAHYAPVSEDERATWTFQGWLPSST